MFSETGSAATAASNPTLSAPSVSRPSPLKRDGTVLSPSVCVMSASRKRTSVQIESSVASPARTPLRRGKPSLRNCAVRKSNLLSARRNPWNVTFAGTRMSISPEPANAVVAPGTLRSV